MKKFLVLTLVVLALICALASCGGQEIVNTTTTTQQVNPEPPVHTHNYDEWKTVKNPTCTENGEEVRYCSCGEKQSEIIVAFGHTPTTAVEDNRKEATCYAVGSYDMVTYCSTCKAELERATHTLSKLEHTPASAVEENRVEPTHEKDGSYQMVVYCSVAECHAELERTTHTLDMLVHHPGSAVVENQVAATCTKNGSYDEVVYCLDDDCGHKELSRKTISVPMIPHTPADAVEENRVEATCTTKGSYDEVVYCANCGTQMSRTKKIVDMVSHTESDWIVDKEPTKTDNGSKHIECTVCGVTIKTEVIGKTGSEGLKFSFSNDGKSCRLVGIGTCTDTDIIIPSIYKERVVTSIGESAFKNCTSVTSVEIPDSVKTVSSYAFIGCTSLKEVYYTGDIEGWLSISFWVDSSPMINGADLYFNNKLVTKIVIPDSITSIADGAFSGCSSLRYVAMEDSVTTIGVSAFENCTSLESIVIGDSVTIIGVSAFENCTSLAIVAMGDSVTAIGWDAFARCISLTRIEIPDSVEGIGGRAFGGCSSLEVIVMGNSVKRIVEYAFSGCTSLASIFIPKSVTFVDYGVFQESTSLTIYCEAESQPSGWNSDWNISKCPVVWNYKPEQ